ncbi:MAG: addiction module antidote protein [Methylococcales bacterium]
MPNFRTFSEVTADYYRDHPEEIDEFLKVTFEEYAKDQDTCALMSALRIVSRAKDISAMAEDTGMTRQGLQKALLAKGNPRLENINAIMHSLGYRLAPEKLDPIHTDN